MSDLYQVQAIHRVIQPGCPAQIPEADDQLPDPRGGLVGRAAEKINPGRSEADPTPFTWGGKRKERRERARQSRLGGSLAVVANSQSHVA